MNADYFSPQAISQVLSDPPRGCDPLPTSADLGFEAAAAELASDPLHSAAALPRTIVRYSIAGTKPHPKQQVFFPAYSEQQLTELIEDMRRFGQRVPIEITQDGTVIDGHQRLSAATRLGWTEVDAVVVEGTEAEIEWRFLSANAVRRQLSPLQRARCAMRLKELVESASTKTLRRSSGNGQLRDQIGDLLGISGREVTRLLRVLKTPPEVQQAFEAGKLSITLAGSVAGHPAGIRDKIAEQIREKGVVKAKQIVARYAKPKNHQSSEPSASSVFRRLLNVLSDVLPRLNAGTDEIFPSIDHIYTDIAILEAAQQLLPRLIERARVVRQCGNYPVVDEDLIL